MNVLCQTNRQILVITAKLVEMEPAMANCQTDLFVSSFTIIIGRTFPVIINQRHGGRSLHPITPECTALYSCTIQREVKNHKCTCGRSAFHRRERTDSLLRRGQPDEC